MGLLSRNVDSGIEMSRPKQQWWTCIKTLRKRLRGFNQQGARYHRKPIKLEQLQRYVQPTPVTTPCGISICEWCCRPLTKANISFDHRISLAAGGQHSLTNLAFSCKVCNKRKLASDPVWWKKFIDFLKVNDKLAWFNQSYKVNWRRRR